MIIQEGGQGGEEVKEKDPLDSDEEVITNFYFYLNKVNIDVLKLHVI